MDITASRPQGSEGEGECLRNVEGRPVERATAISSMSGRNSISFRRRSTNEGGEGRNEGVVITVGDVNGVCLACCLSLTLDGTDRSGRLGLPPPSWVPLGTYLPTIDGRTSERPPTFHA